jgi:DNA-binding XRE family transcriptional regulator
MQLLLVGCVHNVGTQRQQMVRQLGSPLHEELRLLLIERRKRAGISQAELGQRLGWSQRTIGKIETGEKRVTVVELIEIGQALGFDPRAAVARLIKKGNG